MTMDCEPMFTAARCYVYGYDDTVADTSADHKFFNVPYEDDEYLYDRLDVPPEPTTALPSTLHLQPPRITSQFQDQPFRPNYPQGHPFGPAMSQVNPEVEAWLAALARGEYPVVSVPVPAEPEELFCYCMRPDRGEHMIQCSNGEQLCRKLWFHVDCIGEQVPPEEEDWFCRDCKAKRIGKLQHLDPGIVSSSREPNSLPLSRNCATSEPASRPYARKTAEQLPVASPPSTSLIAAFDRSRTRKTRNSASEENRTFATAITKVSTRSTGSGGRIEAGKRCAQFQKPKAISWTKPEEDALISVMKSLIVTKSPSAAGEKRWKVASEMLREDYGIQRSANGVKMTWMRSLRARSNCDERLRKFNGGLRTGLQGGGDGRAAASRAKRVKSGRAD